MLCLTASLAASKKEFQCFKAREVDYVKDHLNALDNCLYLVIALNLKIKKKKCFHCWVSRKHIIECGNLVLSFCFKEIDVYTL